MKFSPNGLKQKNKIGKIQHKIRNARQSDLHKISTEIGKNHAMIFIADVQIANMSKSAKGIAEQHGKNMPAETGLNRTTLEQGWYAFHRQLEYKLG